MGAYLVFLVALKLQAGQMYLIIGLNLVLGFLPGIAWEAHVGGLLVGAAVGYVLVSTREKSSASMQVLGLAAIVVILIGAWVFGNAGLVGISN
jgi:membrane associated rhomboid family serine protease